MSQSSAAPISGSAVEIPSIPFREILPWAIFFGLLAILGIFFITADQGAVSLPAGNAIHEWVHDSRHLLGYPCH